MTTEPKLLTEAEAHDIWQRSFGPNAFVSQLRAHGLIAEEPVDPLDERAIALVRKYYPEAKDTYRGRRFQIAREAMELAPRKLTREMVIAALEQATEDSDGRWQDDFAERLHCRLTEALQ